MSRFLVSMAASYFLFVSFYIVRSLLIVAAVVGKLLITFSPNVLVDDDGAHHGCWWLVWMYVDDHSNSYRQRNVFVYPPQIESMCGGGEDIESQVVGNGECGINGNTKIFQAGECFFL